MSPAWAVATLLALAAGPVEPPPSTGGLVVRSLPGRTLEIRPDRRPTPGTRVAVSAGGIAGPGPDGAFLLELPADTLPRALAILAVSGEQGRAAFLPLPGSTVLPVESRRGARLTVEVAGVTHGPVQVTGGVARIPIVVPPGVTTGVVEAVDPLGNSRQVAVDLHTPDPPRLAALAARQGVVAQGSSAIWAAVASPGGGAGSDADPPSAVAARGRCGAAIAAGPGLWRIPYLAPALAGPDEVLLSGGGSTITLRVEILEGAPALIEAKAPRGSFGPGERAQVEVVVHDLAGNLLEAPELTAAFPGGDLRIRRHDGITTVDAAVPLLLPPWEALPLELRAGTAKLVVPIAVRSGSPVTGRIEVEPRGRTALLRVSARDEFGNLVSPAVLALKASGATAAPLLGGEGELVASLDAAPGVRRSTVELLAPAPLAVAQVEFGPPPETLLAGAFAGAGWGTNGGALSAPRVALGLGVRRSIGPVEAALLLSLERTALQDRVLAAAGGGTRPVERDLDVLSIPILARARLAIDHRFGAALAAGPVAAIAGASSSTDAGRWSERTATAGARALLQADAALGPGRAVLGLGLGTLRLEEGPIVGQLDGASVQLGFELWPLELSR